MICIYLTKKVITLKVECWNYPVFQQFRLEIGFGVFLFVVLGRDECSLVAKKRDHPDPLGSVDSD